MTCMSVIPTAMIAGLVAAQAGALEQEWSDLHGRCLSAVTQGERLNVAGLEDRLPNFTGDMIEQDPFGYRLEIEPLGPGGRTLPAGVWAAEGGRLELWLLEYPTQAGFRAICEVRNGRGTADVTEAEAAQLRARFLDDVTSAAHEALVTDAPRMSAFRFAEVNPRGCPVVTSFSVDAAAGYFRSSVSEAAGAPDCGGPSLARNLITPHGVMPRAAQGG